MYIQWGRPELWLMFPVHTSCTQHRSRSAEYGIWPYIHLELPDSGTQGLSFHYTWKTVHQLFYFSLLNTVNVIQGSLLHYNQTVDICLQMKVIFTDKVLYSCFVIFCETNKRELKDTLAVHILGTVLSIDKYMYTHLHTKICTCTYTISFPLKETKSLNILYSISFILLTIDKCSKATYVPIISSILESRSICFSSCSRTLSNLSFSYLMLTMWSFSCFNLKYGNNNQSCFTQSSEEMTVMVYLQLSCHNSCNRF